MREIDDIKGMIGPFMKALPFMIPILVLFGIVTSKLLNYSEPMYDTEMRMRLDNMSSSFTNNNLYKDFDVLTSSDKVLTEVEVIKSDLIVNKALEAMAIPVSYYRVGKVITTEIYPVSPFIVVEDTARKLNRNVKYGLNIIEINHEMFVETHVGNDTHVVKMGQKITVDGGIITVQLNPKWNEIHGENQVTGNYQFMFNSIDGLRNNFVGKNLLVKAIDKDIDIIRINFSCSNAQKSADFVNQMGKSYVSDFLASKSMAATLTSEFIQSKIDKVADNLVKSEELLEKYRVKKRVLDTQQELDIGLKKIAQLDVQLANLKLKQITMDSLMIYVKNESSNYQKYAPSFEAYGGLLFVELMKKYQILLGERAVLKNKFTEESKEIKNVNFKIEQTKSYIQQSIINHKKLVDYQYTSLQDRVKEERSKFNDLPVKERNFLVLQREFQHLEGLYNFLTKKKMEADIAKTANLTFHKVIKEAHVPYEVSSPKKRFTLLITVFALFLVLTFLVYMRNYFRSKINSKNKTEQLLDQQINIVMGHDYTNEKIKNSNAIANEIIDNLETNHVIAVTSCIGQEGKSFFIQNIVAGLRTTDLKIKVFSDELIDDSNVSMGDEKELLKFKKSDDYAQELIENYDLIIVESESIQNSNNALSLFSIVDHIYFINRYEKTKWNHLKFQKDFIEKYKIANYSYVLNGYSPFSNYMGFISLDNDYSGDKGSALGMIRYCKEWYKAIWTF